MPYDPAVRDNFLEHFFFVKNLNRKEEIEAEKSRPKLPHYQLRFQRYKFRKITFFLSEINNHRQKRIPKKSLTSI